MRIFGFFLGKVLDFIVASSQILYIHDVTGGWFESTVRFLTVTAPDSLSYSFFFFSWCRSSQWCRPCYLEVSVDDLQRVEVGHRLQHLSHHVAGVSLWVVALVQDPVKHLSACRAAGTQGNVMRYMLSHILEEKMKNRANSFFFFSPEVLSCQSADWKAAWQISNLSFQMLYWWLKITASKLRLLSLTFNSKWFLWLAHTCSSWVSFIFIPTRMPKHRNRVPLKEKARLSLSAYP